MLWIDFSPVEILVLAIKTLSRAFGGIGGIGIGGIGGDPDGGDQNTLENWWRIGGR